MTIKAPQAIKHVPPRQGEAVWVLGDLYTFKLDSEDTGGRFALWETVAPVGHDGTSPHYHLAEDETFMILEGELEIHCERETIRATPGSVVHVPKAAMHHFKNIADKPAPFLVMVAPGGFERSFKELGEEALDRSAPPNMRGHPSWSAL